MSEATPDFRLYRSTALTAGCPALNPRAWLQWPSPCFPCKLYEVLLSLVYPKANCMSNSQKGWGKSSQSESRCQPHVAIISGGPHQARPHGEGSMAFLQKLWERRRQDFGRCICKVKPQSGSDDPCWEKEKWAEKVNMWTRHSVCKIYTQHDLFGFLESYVWAFLR